MNNSDKKCGWLNAHNERFRMVLVALAFGLFLASTSVVLWGSYVMILPASTASTNLLTMEYFVRFTAFPLTLFAAAFVAFRHPKSRTWRHPLVALSLFLVVPTIAGACQSHLISLPLSLFLCGICLGIGSGFVFCYLQELVASLKVYDAGFVVFAAAGISAAVYLLIDQLPRVVMLWVGFLVLVPLTIISILVAKRFTPEKHPAFETIPSQQVERCRQAVNESWSSLICIASSAFVVGIVRVEAIKGHEAYLALDATSMIGLFVASVVLLLTWKTVYERITLSRLYQIIFPLTATMYLLLPFFDGSHSSWLMLVVFTVFSVVSSFMMVSCSRIARNQSISPVLVYGAFAGVVYSAIVLGSLVAYIAWQTVGIGFATLSVVALVVIYCMSMVMIAKNRQLVGQSISGAADTGDPNADQTAGASPGNPLFEQQCKAMIGQYGLSAREADVFQLLARGRDTNHIAEELFISKNTVRTHIKNIFSKTCVHSRQELIDLVETIEA